MRRRDEEDQPHIGDSRLPVDENLEAKREGNGGPPARAFAANPASPSEKQPRRQRRRNGRGKPGREIVFAKNRVAGDLGPINEGRFIETILVVEERDDVIAALAHLAGGFRKTRLDPYNKRNDLRSGDLAPERAEGYQTRNA